MPFSKTIQAVKTVNKDPDTFVLDVVRQEGTTDFILSLNQNQLNSGIDANGNEVVPLYTQNTIRFKIAKGQPFDRVTLKDTGAYHRSFDLLIRSNEFQIIARDSKRRSLSQKYGAAILGLNDDSQQALIEHIKPKLLKSLKTLLFS